jgi:hypothetical protein
MIITRRFAASLYLVDAVAQSVRGCLNPSPRIETRPQADSSASAKFDVVRLYPNLFARAARTSRFPESVHATSKAAAEKKAA